MPLYCAQHERVLGPIHSFRNSLSLFPMGIEFLLSHGLGSMAFGSKYGLRRPFSGSFTLLVNWPVIPKGCTSGWRGPEKGLGSWLSGTVAGPFMPMLLGMSFLCRSGGFRQLFFCTFSILTGPISSCRCSDLGRRLNTKPWSTLCGSDGTGMPISRPCLPMKDDVSQDLKLKLFNISLLGRKWWSWKDHV